MISLSFLLEKRFKKQYINYTNGIRRNNLGIFYGFFKGFFALADW
jgi:hypothetical protein